MATIAPLPKERIGAPSHGVVTGADLGIGRAVAVTLPGVGGPGHIDEVAELLATPAAGGATGAAAYLADGGMLLMGPHTGRLVGDEIRRRPGAVQEVADA